MGALYRGLIRPVLFRSDPETAHERAVHALALASLIAPARGVLALLAGEGAAARPVKLFGLKFPNRVGVAAGFDKNAIAWRALGALGFGHVEVGTVTLQAQPGNPKPRVFRYPAEEAVINRMGFNNDGAEAVAARLSKQPGPGKRRVPIGINLGKSRAASIDDAVADYLGSFRLLADHADYVAINISSPNTPDLRRLQDEDRVRVLLEALQGANRARGATSRPILLKIAPDVTFPQVDAILQAIVDFGLSGIIATNTTIARPGVFAHVNEAGGLSGKPVRRRSTEVIHYIARRMDGRLPVIGVGGIDDAVSAGEKLDAGASLVQVYTGMIYAGPFLGREIARGLAVRDTDWVFAPR
ncbi:quinone-dependent dihydroorotate dehydrogenase [Opitutales bacterium ASA1]|uniref:quinone-dependent dihydroorotate dehydrogenase n=1 Tax=Congregicoccus parvus TaxID=3081749 RepID=UPI002B2D7645|nr:quinone-dependent dihydroorotate dehydrogenase [Opitutales bacterium ASA1]